MYRREWKEPHSMRLTYPDNTEYKWDRNGAGTDSLTCLGDHVVTCTHVLTSPGYTSDGTYTCTGHNVGSDGGDVNSTSIIQLTIGKFISSNQEPTETSKQPIRTRDLGHVTGSANQGPVFPDSVGSCFQPPTSDQYLPLVQDPLVSISLTELSMLTTETKSVKCTVASKPNIGKEKIKWQYHNGTEVDHGSMIVYRAIDSHTWSAELTLTTPSKNAEGEYKCVAAGVEQIVIVTIAEAVFLGTPQLFFSPEHSVAKYGPVTIECRVGGFPEPTVGLSLRIGENIIVSPPQMSKLYNTGHNKQNPSPEDATKSGSDCICFQVLKVQFERSTTCEDTEYTCIVEGAEGDESNVITKTVTEPSPIIEDCYTDFMPYIIGAGIGAGGVILIAVITILIVLLFIGSRGVEDEKRVPSPTKPMELLSGAYKFLTSQE
eukprot:sb/3464899/